MPHVDIAEHSVTRRTARRVTQAVDRSCSLQATLRCTKASSRAAERMLRRSELPAQKSECARHPRCCHDQVFTESDTTVGHVGAFATVRLDELVCINDR